MFLAMSWTLTSTFINVSKNLSLISELTAEVTNLKKEKASLQDEIRDIKAEKDRQLKRQADSFRESQNAEQKLDQVFCKKFHKKFHCYFL